MEAGSGNLALLHCNCLQACLVAYSNILRRDMNTTCITINRGVWHHGSGTIRRGLMNMEAFWSKPSVKVEIKATWEVVSTCEVLWSARLNTSKVSVNRQDRSSQWEATKKSVGLSSARVVFVRRDRSKRRWTATVRHLICLTSGVGDWTADIVTMIDIATTRWRLKSFEDRSLLRSCERAPLLAFARLQSLILWHFQ